MRCDAKSSTLALSCRAPCRATPPVMVADRLPPVSPNGTTSVSPTTTRTCSNGTPNSSAAIWARVVWWLWPCGIWPVNSTTMPSSSSRRRIDSMPIGPLGPLRLARAGSGLDERCHADAEVAALGSRFGLPAPERGKVHELGDPLQRLPRRDPDQRPPGDHDGRRIGARGDVTQPDLERIEAEILGDEVEDAFPHERLGRPRAAVGDVRRLVRHDRGRLETQGRELVRAREASPR